MKTVTIEIIRSWEPCYDPGKYKTRKKNISALDILKHKDVPDKDKLWCVLREEMLEPIVMKKFAIWCGREALKLIDKPDERSVKALDIAEKYLAGNASLEEMQEAAEAAWAAVEAAWAAARAAWAAEAAAKAAAWAAEAAKAAWAAAAEAARAAWAAEAAAEAAEAAKAAQVQKLIELIGE